MAPETLLNVTQEALLLAIMLSAGPALAALVVGVIVAALQSAMRMPDVTLAFVPKIAAVLTAVVLMGMAAMTELKTFATTLFDLLPTIR
jgi:flagellar biosynthetic protein FliQ